MCNNLLQLNQHIRSGFYPSSLDNFAADSCESSGVFLLPEGSSDGTTPHCDRHTHRVNELPEPVSP